MIEELKIAGYIAIGVLVLYAGLRFITERAIRRIVKTELDSVIESDNFKVKSKFE